MPALVFLPAALRIRLNSIICRGTVMLQCVAVDDWRFVNLHPVLAHVHVVHTCHQSHQRTHVQGCLPVGGDSLCLCKEEERGRDHCDGDDPEGDGNTVIWLQESITWAGHGLCA